VTTRERDLPLTLSALAGAVVLLAAVVLALAHARPIAFRSGSMAPTIPTGSVALVRRVPASRLEVGDIVTVPSGDSAVTHRIVQMTLGDGTATLQLQGDANPVPDAQLHQVTHAERVVFSEPWVGYVLAGLTGPAGLFLAGVYVWWLLRRLVRGAPSPARGARHRRRSPGRRLATSAMVLALALAGGMVVSAPAAWAAWTDTVPVGTTTLTTKVIATPASFTCGGIGILSVTFNWTAVPGATSYDLHYGSGGSQVLTQAGTSHTFISALSGGTAWVQANVGYGATTWTSVASTTRSYTVAVISFCS
jgi:signal peptidase I